MKIYWLKFNCSEEEYERITPLLSEQRRCYCDDKKSLNAKLCSAFSYAVLRYILKKDYGIDACPVFSFRGHGKPFMENIDLSFNISHSGNIVMCTVTEKETGIDIQHIRPITIRAAEKFCTSEEMERVRSCDDKDREICRLWCIKESRGKLTGKGFQEGFSAFSADSLIENGEAVCLTCENGFISACGYKCEFDGKVELSEITAEKLISFL